MPASSVPVREPSAVAEARRQAVAVASRLRFSEESAGRVALVATEAATNILRHAGEGELLVSRVSHPGRDGVEIIALDKGPGIGNLSQAMRDGYSTAGGAGTGLGAITRLASQFDIYTAPGKGTALVARLFADGTAAPEPVATPVEWAGVEVPMPGETECGDAFMVRTGGTAAFVALSDGLGHGPGAAEASAKAISIFEKGAGDAVEELITRMHGALRSTRGAAVAIAYLCAARRTLRFTSVGNVTGAVVNGSSVRQMLALPGTVGHEMHKIREFTYDFPTGSTVVIHSDGIVSRWSLDPYPGLTERDPSLIAAVIYRDFKRGRDDASVIVLRHPLHARERA